MLQSSAIDNVNGFVFLGNGKNLSCGPKCASYLNYQENQIACSTCSNLTVLDNNQCVDACPVGKFNNGGVCFRCKDGICVNLLNDFFDVRKVANNKIEVTQIKPVVGLRTPLSANFSNSVLGALPVTDYDLNIEDLPEQKKFVYTYNFKDSFDPTNKFITVNLLNQGLTDNNNNALSTQVWTFPVDKKTDVVYNSSIISPLLAAAAIPAVVVPAVVAPVVASTILQPQVPTE